MKTDTPKAFSRDFTQGRVLPALISFAFPLFLANLLQAAYNVVDMVVVGQVVGEAGLSGLSIGGDILSFLTFLSMGFSNASQVIISQYIGAGLRERLSRFIGTMASFLLLCAVGMSTVCLILREQILRWMNTPAESWIRRWPMPVPVCSVWSSFMGITSSAPFCGAWATPGGPFCLSPSPPCST